MRLFVAVPLPLNVQEDMDLHLRALRTICTSVKWVEKQNLHITLFFLGEAPESKLPEILQALGTVQAKGAFEVECGGLDTFPRSNHPKVLFIPVQQGGDQLKELSKGVARALMPLGFQPDEKGFHAHVTVGRVRKDQKPEKDLLGPTTNDFWKKLFQSKVSEFVLYDSRLSSSGADYQAVRAFPLK